MAFGAEGAQVVKYPKTPHLPFSPGVAEDDIILPFGDFKLPILSEDVVVTEKLDGGNCSIHCGKVYARTVTTGASHASFGPIKELAANITYLVPAKYQLFGENMFGVHSIEYNELDSFFYLFGILEEGKFWLSWDHVTELANEIGILTVPVASRGQFASFVELELKIKTEMGKSSNCGTCQPEGFVVRTVSGFPYSSLGQHIAKYVRAGHVQTEDSWRKTWRQAKIHKH